jgi:hypothetical protein
LINQQHRTVGLPFNREGFVQQRLSLDRRRGGVATLKDRVPSGPKAGTTDQSRPRLTGGDHRPIHPAMDRHEES